MAQYPAVVAGDDAGHAAREHVEDGPGWPEGLAAAAIRELLQETGYACTEDQLGPLVAGEVVMGHGSRLDHESPRVYTTASTCGRLRSILKAVSLRRAFRRARRGSA